MDIEGLAVIIGGQRFEGESKKWKISVSMKAYIYFNGRLWAQKSCKILVLGFYTV